MRLLGQLLEAREEAAGLARVPPRALDDARRAELRQTIRSEASPRHVPTRILSVEGVPYTLSGKKVEIAVREILEGGEPRNKEALANPEALNYFRDRKELST